MNFINKIIHASLSNKLLVFVGAIFVVIGGLWSTQNMDIDVFPDLTAPTVVIMTDCTGMAPEEVEQLVTFPIETAVNGATDVRRVRSASLQGHSFVWAEFDWGTDVYRARQIISEKMVALSGTFPEGIVPVLSPQSSVMGEILIIGMQAGDSTSQMDLRTLADWVVKPAILATGGVSQVSNIGGQLKQYQILADPIRMDAYGVTMAELEEVGRTFSNNSTGSVVRDHGNEYAIRGMARTTDLEVLKQTFIKMSGEHPVFLSDVAELVVAPELRMGNATMSGQSAVLLAVSKQPNINTLEVTEAIERNLESVAATLPADVTLDTHIFRQSDFIESSVGNVGRALLEGAIFAVIILIIFLASGRTTLISVLAIPISLLGTCIVLKLLGMNINTMTLGGMCIAIGSLVDDAIIDVENVYKRLRQNHALPPSERKSIFDVVFEASKEIRASILNATFIIMVAFVPLFFLSGMEGRMLIPLGTAYIIALFISLIVAMTLTPLLCKILLGNEKYLERQQRDSYVSRKISAAYSVALNWVLVHKKTVVGFVCLLLLVSIVLFKFMGRSFLPEFNEGSAVITAVAKPGVSLDVNDQLGLMLEQALLEVPEVVGTARRTGRGDLDEHSQATYGAEIDVKLLIDERSKDEVFEDMRLAMARVPGVVTTIGQPLGHRIDHMLSGTKAAIAVKVFGPEVSRLYMIGNQIKDAVRDIPGLVDVSVEQQVEVPQLQIRADRAALAHYGISIGDFNHFVQMAFSGEKIADMYEGQQRYDIIMRLAPEYTTDVEGVLNSLIDTGDGRKVPLNQVAEIVSAGGPSSITRENVQRKLVVSANVSGRDVGRAVDDMRNAVAEKVSLPEGYRIEYGGQFENAQAATRTLTLTTIAAILIIFLLLYGEFKNISLATLVLMNLPFALIGGVLAVFFSSGVISIPSIIGFITLFGIATRNGILLISRYQHLREQGQGIRKTVITGSADRLNPILMTALTSALALIPLVINGDSTGNEIQSPMAVVVLGGLLSSTMLNIFLMPVVYEWFEGRKKSSTSK